MDQKKQNDIALMRYTAIAPLVSGTDEEFQSHRAYYNAFSTKGIKDADGNLRHYAPATISKWYSSYKKNGFDGLLPTGRSDCGVSRKIDTGLLEQIRYLRTNFPRLPAAAIYRRLLENGTLLKGIVCAPG